MRSFNLDTTNVLENTTIVNPKLQVEIQNVYKSFFRDGNETKILDDISLNIREGEFISLLGPSGCGKSTLLKMIGGLLDITSGELKVAGTEMKKPTERIGYMFQKSVLLPWRTVEQNIVLPIELAKGDMERAKNRVGDLLELVELAGYENHYPNELSGGMQQRISLARTLMTDPDILLLDEPFGALDEFTRENLNFSLMDIVEKSGKTVVLVTHNISEAVLMSNRIVVLGINPGHVLEDLHINFNKPRTDEVMLTKEYSDYVAHLRKLLGVGRG